MHFNNNKTVFILSFGFFFILVPMLILVAVAIHRIQHNIESIDSVVHHQITKTKLITKMLSAARERSLLMLEMRLTDDPFSRDEKMMRFHQHGNIFAQSRMQLMEMNLSVDEMIVLKQQGKLTKVTVPIQRKIVESLIEDNTSGDVSRLIIEKAVPMQDLVFEKLSILLDMQQKESAKSFQNSAAESTNSIITMSVLALAVFLTCVFISVYIVKRITRSEKLLFREKERAQVTLHSIGDAVITTDKAGNIEYLNEEAEYLTGWLNNDACKRPISEVCVIIKEDEKEHYYHPFEEVIKGKRVVSSQGESVIKMKNNQAFAVEYTASPIFGTDSELDGVIIVLRNVTETRVLSHQLAYQATHDALTGLINRAEFEYITEKVIKDSENTNRHHGLCYVDIDQFKVINDTCGHQAGDELLKQLATLLKTCVRDNDLVSRLGGDEFGILFRDCEIDEAKDILESLKEAISSQRFIWDNKSFTMSISAGLVELSSQTGSLADIFSAVDSACYAAKEQGRNRVHVYREDDLIISTMEGEMHWVHRINEALEENRFRLFFQTISPLGKYYKDVACCELLVRMISKDGDVIPPMAFIPSAERYNLMSNIDRWVIREAMSIIASNRDVLRDNQFHFSINLSAQSLSDNDFLCFIKEQFKEFDLLPQRFCFEITETTAILNLSIAKEFISTLKEMGCSFSLDDFGSGLSSFEYLKNLSVDYLKIDGAFVKNLVNDQVDKAMVQSINQVGHVMGIKTIAEFAENEKIISILQDIGVDFAQGYGVSKPAEFKSVAEVLCKAYENNIYSVAN